MAKDEWLDKAWDCIDKENYSEAIKLFEKAAEEGAVEAYCELGNLYHQGKGIEKDYHRAFDYYLKGAKAGDPYCMNNLSMCYFWGHGTETDVQKSAFYNEKAAKAGVVRAMFETGLDYVRGYGASQNIEKALYWLKKAAEEGYTDALMELGNLYFNGQYLEKDLEKSFSYFKMGAELGDLDPKMQLSIFYEKGLVVKKDIEKAKALQQDVFDSFYEKAVAEDDGLAQFRMGEYYYYGLPLIGIDTDYSQAAVWYERSANNGFDNAQNNIGNMYAYGVGVAQNYEKAFYWYSQAAERMNQTAISNVANCYYWGGGVKQDFGKAAELHTKAAQLGYANSQEVLGEMYLEGKGVEKNFTMAVQWLKESCKNGERSAYGPLGDCYRKGLGVDKNEKMAFKLYQKGAEEGDLRSKVSMSECLIEGWGVPCDYKQANTILEAVCNEEEDYRENIVTVVSHEDKVGNIFVENPLDEYNLQYYAKAYYLRGILAYNGKDKDVDDASKAIAMLRMADKLGYVNEDAPEETAEKMLNRIIGSTNKEQTCNATDCHVEVRERGKIGERFEVVLHHANGTESVVKFKGRNKFIYILALLIAHEGKSVSGLTTTHFAYWRDTLAELAKASCINVDSFSNWIDEFVYAETEESKDIDEDITFCAFRGDRYSNALSGANRAILSSCTSDDEFELFKLRSTGGRRAITTMSLDYSQIILPDSLEDYMDSLPTRKEIENYIPPKSRKFPRKRKKDKIAE